VTLQCGDYGLERRTISHCDVCGQHEVEGVAARSGRNVMICLDCFTRALNLPTDDTVDRLRELLCDLEHELTRCRFPNAELMRRLKREVGAL